MRGSDRKVYPLKEVDSPELLEHVTHNSHLHNDVTHPMPLQLYTGRVGVFA